MQQESRKIYLSVGGNQGNVRQTMLSMLVCFRESGFFHNIFVSSLYKTKPWGRINQPHFINMCLFLETTKKPTELLEYILDIEKKLGRIRNLKWGPRTIDIDYLYDEKYTEYKDEKLTLPHRYMLERAFVLFPLAEIAPELTIAGTSISKCLEFVDSKQIELIGKL